MPKEYEDYLRLTLAAKSISTIFVAHIDNIYVCLTHSTSLGPWIFDFGASNHISLVIKIFSPPLLLLHPYL